MRAQLVPADFTYEVLAPTYRVRLWTAPASPLEAWLVDDWTFDDVADAREVIAWAEDSLRGLNFEVLAQGGHSDAWARIYGAAPPHVADEHREALTD